MASKMEACDECSRSCLSLHRAKLDPYPIVSSFFKVMFGNQFSEILIMPPKFARTIIAMEGRSTYLEDPTGQKWEVNLSRVKGSLAFQKGWNEFSVDHGIELGDFLVFHYFKESHFVVQIFGKSGCEKPMTFSSKNYQNKRAKLTTGFIPRSPVDFSCKVSPAKESSDVSFDPSFSADFSYRKKDVKKGRNIPEIRVNVPREGNTNKRPRDVETDYMIESCFMTNIITSYSTEDDRRDCLFDLSVFEMPEKKLEGAITLSLQNTPTQVASFDVEKCRMDNDVFDISNEVDFIELPNDVGSRGVDMPLNISPPLKTITLPHETVFSAPIASCWIPPGRTSIVKREPKTGEKAANSLQDSAILSAPNGYKVKSNSLGWHSSSSSSKTKDKPQRDIKMSPKALKVCDSPSAQAIQITCLITHNNETFLELPRPLTVRKCDQHTGKLEQNLVLLRDPVGRLWPVIYHQRNGLKALTSGWKEFRNSNGVRTGDKCTFVVENIDKGIVQVQIVSKL